jgi:hypothetical protein
MEADWEDGDKILSVVGTALGVFKWAYFMPSAETRLHDCDEYDDYSVLDQDRYDALVN